MDLDDLRLELTELSPENLDELWQLGQVIGEKALPFVGWLIVLLAENEIRRRANPDGHTEDVKEALAALPIDRWPDQDVSAGRLAAMRAATYAPRVRPIMQFVVERLREEDERRQAIDAVANGS